MTHRAVVGCKPLLAARIARNRFEHGRVVLTIRSQRPVGVGVLQRALLDALLNQPESPQLNLNCLKVLVADIDSPSLETRIGCNLDLKGFSQDRIQRPRRTWWAPDTRRWSPSLTSPRFLCHPLRI